MTSPAPRMTDKAILLLGDFLCLSVLSFCWAIISARRWITFIRTGRWTGEEEAYQVFKKTANAPLHRGDTDLSSGLPSRSTPLGD